MQSNLKIATAHPTIGNLQTAREAVAVASISNRQSNERLSEAAMRIDPHRWTKPIETALLGGISSEELRLDYQELAITFVSVLLKQRHASELLQLAKTAHAEALKQIVTAHDTIADRSAEGWVKQYLRAAFVFDSQESIEEKPKPQPPPQIPGSIIVRAKRIVLRTFDEFARSIPVKNGYYTSASVVKSGQYRSSPVNGFRTREVFALPLDHQDELHINVQLYEQLQRTEPLAKIAKEALRFFCPNESAGENFYEARIVDALLDFQGPKAHVSDGNGVVEEIRRQQRESLTNSILFQTRQLTLLQFRKEYEELIRLLVAATAEATNSIKNGRPTGDREFCYLAHWKFWIAMNNCLAVDLKLREFGELLKPLEDSARAYDSRESVEREFERLAGTFREIKSAVKS